MTSPEFLLPNWEAPENVRAASSLRRGGVSQGNHAGFNLGAHCGDNPAHVEGNRRLLRGRLGLAAEPVWLNQVHGNQVVYAPDLAVGDIPAADAAWTDRPEQAVVVLTADCLPVLFCNRAGTRVAAAHAGWRGLAAGILRETVAAMTDSAATGSATTGSAEHPEDLLAWLGPAIGPDSFEVGEDVLATFADRLPGSEALFAPLGEHDGQQKFLADIYELARLELAGCGVRSVRGGGRDTFAEREAFFSHRRDGRQEGGGAVGTGRMATLVWLAGEPS